MNRRQVLKSCLGVAIGYNFVNGKVLGNEWRKQAGEISEYFSMTVNGIPFVVNYAAAAYSFANIDVDKPLEVVVTALKPDFWKNGVEIFAINAWYQTCSGREQYSVYYKLCYENSGVPAR